MKKTIYLYSGEGTRSEKSSFKLIKNAPQTAPMWKEIEKNLASDLNLNLDEILAFPNIHHCPHSPLITVISQICLSELWKSWGYRPDTVVGHSIGELSAAYQAGIYSLKDILKLTYNIGKVTSLLEGGMAHGSVTSAEMDKLQHHLAARNFTLSSGQHITVSEVGERLEDLLIEYPHLHRMTPPHPWHHRNYRYYSKELTAPSAGKADLSQFVSGVTANFEDTLQDDHWQHWLTGEIDFHGAIKEIAKRYGDNEVEIIEIGFHPVLEQCRVEFDSCTYVSSMYREEDELFWIIHQREKLDTLPFEQELSKVIEEYWPGLEYDEPLSYQGFTSLKFVEFSMLLEPFFPTLVPQDFYRYKTVNELIKGFAKESSKMTRGYTVARKVPVVIAGMSCKFPSAAESPIKFWKILQEGQDQVRSDTLRGDFEAGFLSEKASRFDHKFFDISEAEAKTVDPQQILALELTELLFRDSGIDPQLIDRNRVGVYLGAWNQEFTGDRSSVYYPTGTNPSIIASRISYHYDLRGPSWVANTACSSSLVAVHYACKDIEAGRVDYAIAGGVNMILGNEYTHSMRDSGFLSKDQRCKAFDDSANGYVRSEGGGLVLLVRKELVEKYYAEVLGSSINQNGRRAQVITAPHPQAQEELIVDACRDAGISPGDISFIECHGTGTKIGDPIEVSALQNSVSKNRQSLCLLGSVKSNIGHLESAAGIAGLIKSILSLYYGAVPGNIHFNTANQYIDFDTHLLKVVTESTPIDKEALVGVSSFGFGGSNGHVILKGANETNRKQLVEQEWPFNENRAVPLARYYQLDTDSEVQLTETPPAKTQEEKPFVNIGDFVNNLLFDLTGIKTINPDIALTDQGLDSLSATQFVTSLQEKLKVELDTDLLFDYPTFDQLVSHLVEVTGMNPIQEINSNKHTRDSVAKLVTDLFSEHTNISAIDPDVELTDQGLDSLSATQFLSQLEKQLKIEIDVDILYTNPVYEQFVDKIYSSLEK